MPKAKLIPNGSDILNIDQAAAMLGVGTGSLYRLAKDGRVPATRLGDVWRFSNLGLERWIRTEAARNVK
jgi:DNA repair protein RadD